ncbi:hypothetical protein DINM_001979 [Dirofilaria immitis]|nr:hypothetical protein [Dirofilaria immitis]
MVLWLILLLLLLPTLTASIRCINGGEWIAHACTMDLQCEPYKRKQQIVLHALAQNVVQCHAQIMVPQQCPYGGEVIGLECLSSKSCQYLAPEIPVLCVQGTCCAYPFPNYFSTRFT